MTEQEWRQQVMTVAKTLRETSPGLSQDKAFRVARDIVDAKRKDVKAKRRKRNIARKEQ